MPVATKTAIDTMVTVVGHSTRSCSLGVMRSDPLEATSATNVATPNAPIDGDRAFIGIAVHEFSPRAGSLEELFLNWTTNPSTSEEVVES
jgi:hypothetical protein